MDLKKIIPLEDPVGKITESWTSDDGLNINKVRSPFGVIGIIYEARPNVTSDVSGLCLKSGNASILRGSSYCLDSNLKILNTLQKALEKNNLSKNCIQLIESKDREDTIEFMNMTEYIDLIVPRGGRGLIDTLVNNSKVPFILDTSISMINRGKIRVAARNNQSIPAGVALDKFGKPTTDAKKALAGVQLPIAGFRGSGLAWMVDILSGVLTGGNHAGRVKDPFDDFSGPQNIGHLFITFKANLFQKNYNQRIKDNIKTIKKLPKIKGIKEIMYPGQNKYARYKNNSKKEISIPDIIKKDLETLIS